VKNTKKQMTRIRVAQVVEYMVDDTWIDLLKGAIESGEVNAVEEVLGDIECHEGQDTINTTRLTIETPDRIDWAPKVLTVDPKAAKGGCRLVVTERQTYVVPSGPVANEVRKAVKADDREHLDELINFLADDGAEDVITECVSVEVTK